MSYPMNQINVKAASEAEYAAINRHNNLLRRERLPIPLEEFVQGMKNIPSFVEVIGWGIWNAEHSEIIAQGNAVLMHMGENQHLAQIDLSVLKEYRRQGLGRQLLALIAGACQAHQRRLLMTETIDRVPGGAAFMERIGAQKGLEGHVNQLRISDLDRSLVEHWLAQAAQHTAGFELGLWEGPYPEAQLAEIARLIELTNQQPFGDLEIEDMHMTPEQLRQSEQMLFARGNQRWTFYATEKATGKFAGYTETVWNPNRPEILRQDMTGVFPEYRNRGLGRWLKAAMLDKALKEHPEIKFVRTQNADVNAAMLKINTELGFQPYMATALWQVELKRVQEYLGKTLSE